ncbi:MAG: hypothetical protein EZS28_025118 [Streblomastix strix]|uniref:Uncharacterized protein n=1 Tax=Streblomastix strix TaxID=222440 RepID=A0A5J4VA03_9EUKA|nr:MAG: hypothetical protein EZS28_025118 [Streblomastix strix]
MSFIVPLNPFESCQSNIIPAPSDLTYPLTEASKALHCPSGECTHSLLNRIVISRNLIRLTAPHKADLHSPLRIL